MPRSLSPRDLAALGARLKTVNQKLARTYPGDPIGRQPVHTFIAGADTFTRDSARRIGAQAIKALDEYGRNARSFAEAIDLPHSDPFFAEKVRVRVLEKLEREPIEDFRLDFEDG